MNPEPDVLKDSPSLRVTVENPYHPVCVRLVEAFWDDLGVRYQDDTPCQYKPEDVIGERTVFVVAWFGDAAAGCGAIRPMTAGDAPDAAVDAAEVKRIYVVPQWRRRGVARAILHELERHAVAFGYRTLKLETGLYQPEAIRLYESEGYQQIACFPPHDTDPLSLCYEKILAGKEK